MSRDRDFAIFAIVNELLIIKVISY